MINFIEGKINLAEKHISVTSSYGDLNALSENALIEKRKDGEEQIYYYVEAVVDGMRFGVFIACLGEGIPWLLLRWLDGPCTSKGWDGVSEKGLKDEYRLLSNFIEKKIEIPPDSQRNRKRAWNLRWGVLGISYDVRSFDIAIFMKPK